MAVLMLGWIAALVLSVAIPADENGTGWRVDKRAGLEFQHRVRGRQSLEVAVQGPRISRGTYGLRFEVRW